MKRTPLPKFQLFMVLLVQVAEPITATVIYPFINQFVRDTGITGGDERKTGYYGGIIESIFFLTEALTVFHWGQLSDYYGRRPVLLIGPLGLAFSMFCFGLSSTFWPLVVYRSLQGVFNGNLGMCVSRTVMAEITDSTNIGDAFAFNPMMWSCGTTIAPAIGGVLTAPAERWPNTLGKIAILRDYPYFLPCLVAAMVAFVSFVISFVGLKETLPSASLKRNKPNAIRYARETTSGEHDASTALISESVGQSYLAIEQPASEAELDERPPTFRSILTRETIILCINHGILSFTDIAYQALFPLQMSTPIEYGGLGFDPYTIGVIMGVWGFVNAFVQLLLLGHLIRRFGSRKVYIFSYACFFFCVLCYPVSSYFAKQASQVDRKVWVVIFVQLFFRLVIFMSYGGIQILVVERTPSKALGSLNGLVQMAGCVTKSIAPSVATSLFSISLEKHIAGGHMVYYVLLAVIVLGIQLARMIPLKG
ncbi:major facilitator superfamily multidrug-resistance, DHA1 sub-family [Cyathus striatus]|nr:major facilitator superfamily multidrug-resistance, DHA1 sub-family [Cyathus striatus]